MHRNLSAGNTLAILGEEVQKKISEGMNDVSLTTDGLIQKAMSYTSELSNDVCRGCDSAAYDLLRLGLVLRHACISGYYNYNYTSLL